jgi:hypothetical protein
MTVSADDRFLDKKETKEKGSGNPVKDKGLKN